MKLLRLMLSMLMCVFIFTSCNDNDEETKFVYGFACSEDLFEFVDVKATLTVSSGDEVSVNLTPAMMKQGTTIFKSPSQGMLEWLQTNTYDGDLGATLTISFTKKDIDYSQCKAPYSVFTNMLPYLKKVYKGDNIYNINDVDININLGYTPQVVTGEDLEKLVDRLVSNPIVRTKE